MNTSRSQGLLIAGLGIPAVGKSSVLSRVAEKKGWCFWAEPEESEWPAAIHTQSLSGVFTTLSWFRSIRVPNLYLAKQASNSGKTALLDSYYDVVMSRYINAQSMDWLIQRTDPYFSLIQEMARLDNIYLPKADIVIFFKVSLEVWERLIFSRSRNLDFQSVFPHAYQFQEILQQAIEAEAEAFRTTVITFEPSFSSAENAADALLNLLQPHISSIDGGIYEFNDCDNLET